MTIELEEAIGKKEKKRIEMKKKEGDDDEKGRRKSRISNGRKRQNWRGGERMQLEDVKR